MHVGGSEIKLSLVYKAVHGNDILLSKQVVRGNLKFSTFSLSLLILNQGHFSNETKICLVF